MQQDQTLPQSRTGWQDRMPPGLARFGLRVTMLSAALHAYIGWRLLPALPLGTTGATIVIVLLACSAVMLPLGMFARFLVVRPAAADLLTWVGALAMGLFSSTLVLTVLRDIVLIPVSSMPIREASAVLVPALALLVTVVGFANARRLPRVVEVDIPLAGLPPALEGFSIVQLSDIHVGATIKADYVRAVVERVNGLDADLVAITGDIVDGSVDRLASEVAPLGALKSRHGTYMVTGNHEYYSGVAPWLAEFRRLGLNVLANAHKVIEHDGAQLVVAGVNDFSAQYFDAEQRSDPRAALAGSPDGLPRILLAHQPRSAAAADAAGFDLQLSGHTHGGQFWPWNHLVRLQQPYTAGLHRLNHLWVYTSRGTGYWGPPKRFGAPSEITRLRLVCA